jgi:hypothetical protein
MKDLLQHLSSIQPGSITDTVHLEPLLAASWHEFDGGDAQGMAGDKLHGRMNDVVWVPPLLTFTIERHGGTVHGSSRAERHEWTLDVHARTADGVRIGHKQLRPMARRLDVRPLAELVARLILDRQVDNRLRWENDGSVRVQIGKILPAGSAVQQTLQGRRKRFSKALDGLLVRAGWQCVRPNVHRPPAANP